MPNSGRRTSDDPTPARRSVLGWPLGGFSLARGVHYGPAVANREMSPSPCPDRPRSLRRKDVGFCFFRPKRPVSWLAPVQLLTTGLQVGLADRLGAYLDKRELQQLFEQPPLEEPGGRDGLWLDYVADTGDGFHATYAIAYLLGQRQLAVKGTAALPRAQVLVMGGDQVYPIPSGEAYDDRLRGPFRAALPDVEPGEPRPTLYALPGNHDWYDGLTAFFRIFAGLATTVGGWDTRQQRSYFAIKLPQKWWLFGLDAQQGAHIDDPQLEYFHSVIAEQMEHDDRIILCTPEPAWVEGQRNDNEYSAVDYFLRKVIDAEGQQQWLTKKHPDTGLEPKRVAVPLMLSGDWHHYCRYQSSDTIGEPRQLITSGGGGAYLYGTNRLPRSMTVPPPNMRPPKSSEERRYRLRKRFPSFWRSVWLGLGALVRLPLRNPTFVLLLGLLQGLLLYAERREPRVIGVGEVIMAGILFLLALFLAAGLSTGRKPWIRIGVLTVLHTIAQVEIGRVVLPLWNRFPGLDLSFWKPSSDLERSVFTMTRTVLTVGHDVVQYLAYGLLAGILSAVVVAVYLIVASLFGLNFNELYASQRIEGYKGFLRMHIARDGSLTIYSIGVRRVRRIGPSFVRWHWRAQPKAEAYVPWFRPRRRLRPHLIETVRIPPAQDSTQVLTAGPV